MPVSRLLPKPIQMALLPSLASVNVTQLTTQALSDGSGNLDLEKVFTSWASNTPLNDAKVLASGKKVVANLKATLIAKRFT